MLKRGPVKSVQNYLDRAPKVSQMCILDLTKLVFCMFVHFEALQSLFVSQIVWLEGQLDFFCGYFWVLV